MKRQLTITRYVLSALIGGHIFAVRGPTWQLGHKAVDFSLATFSIHYWPFIMAPYYVLFASAGAYHLAYGWSQALRLLLPARTLSSPSPLIRGLFKVEKGPVFNGLVAGFLAASMVAVVAFGDLLPGMNVSKERWNEYKTFFELIAPSFLLPWKK